MRGHESFKSVSVGEVPVDVGLAHVREQLLQDVFPSLYMSRAPETFDSPRRTSSCQVEPILMCRVVGMTWLVRADDEDEVVLGRELTPLKRAHQHEVVGSMTVYSYTVLATSNIYIVAQQVTELMMTV